LLNKMKTKLFLFPALFLVLIKQSFAHCPLCVVGAASLAVGASYLGVSKAAIGLFIGAFAIAIGWWIAKLIKKQYIPYQKSIIILISFLTTIIPIMPYIKGAYPLYISFLGPYGTTYAADLFLSGSLAGGFIVLIAPWLSSTITKLRKGKQIPFQGILLTFFLLIVLSIVIQLVI